MSNDHEASEPDILVADDMKKMMSIKIDQSKKRSVFNMLLILNFCQVQLRNINSQDRSKVEKVISKTCMEQSITVLFM